MQHNFTYEIFFGKRGTSDFSMRLDSHSSTLGLDLEFKQVMIHLLGMHSKTELFNQLGFSSNNQIYLHSSTKSLH